MVAAAVAWVGFGCNDRTSADRVTLRVETVPRGATVLVDGRPSTVTTPATLPDLEAGRSYVIAVSRDGYLSRPEARTVVARPDAAPVRFELIAKVDLRVEATPSGALVMLDDRRLGQAPLTVPVARGAEHRITVAATDYLEKTVVWTADADDTLEVELEPSVQIDVVSSPSPASVLVDDAVLGETPALVDVPASRRFELVARRPGYRDARRRVDGRRLESGDTVELTLKPLPLSALPLTPEERGEVRRLQGELRRARARLGRTRALHDRSIRQLERLGRGGEVHTRARLDGIIDATTDRIEELDLVIHDLEGQLEGIRDVASRKPKAVPGSVPKRPGRNGPK
jgi:hypothetical protein